MILVTGGTGFIGRHLLDRLSSLNIPVKCLVRPGRARRRLPESVTEVPGDLCSGAGIREAIEGVHTVIHLAGVTKALSREEYFTGNVEATERLSSALAGRGVRLVHVSSLAAVGPSPDGVPLDEDAEPRPFTAYGNSKLQAERAVRRMVPEAVIVRPPVVYGPRDIDVFQMLKSVARGMVLEIGGVERWFSAIYVGDLAEGLVTAARSPEAAGKTYFLTHAKPVSWNELGRTAARIMNRRALTVRVPAAVAYGVGGFAEWWARLRRKPGIISREKVREAQCRYWTCSAERAASEIGFKAKTGLEEGLQQTLAWYKEAGWLTY